MKNKRVNGYELREPTVGDVPELFDMMVGGEGNDMKSVVHSLIRNCVFKEGVPLGDDYKTIPIRDMRELVTELLKMTGLDSEKK